MGTAIMPGVGTVVGALGGALLGGIGGYISSRKARRKRRRIRRQLAFARSRADEIVGRLTAEGSTFARARDFLKNTFEEGGNSAFASSVAQGVRAAQAGRGLFSGNIGALQEGQARGLAATQLQASLAPLAGTFEAQPEILRQNLISQMFQRGVAASGVNNLSNQFESVAGGIISGASGGLQVGQNLSQAFNLGGAGGAGGAPSAGMSFAGVQGSSGFQGGPTSVGDDPLQRFNNPSLLA